MFSQNTGPLLNGYGFHGRGQTSEEQKCYQNDFSSFSPMKTPLFGKDIIIKNSPGLNQQCVEVCVAPNGWLYSFYWNPIDKGFAYYIMKSVDNGITWTELTMVDFPNTTKIISEMDILACGTDDSNIKLFLGLVLTDNPGHFDQGIVLRFNGNNGEIEDELLHDQDFSDIHSISLASDYPYNAENANPYSIAVLYTRSKSLSFFQDVVFCSSSDGGMSFDHKQVIWTSDEVDVYHVDLSYAWSPSKNSGRYFGVWEVKPQLLDNTGHIYTAHTEPNFDSPFTTPVCLDSLVPSIINNCLLPTISCQVDDTENEDSDITQVVLCETKISGSDTYGISGWYNMSSTNSNSFIPFTFTDPSHNSSKPDIAYNAFGNHFMVTYFDSTTKELPLITNDLNLTNPTLWNIVSSGYNDSQEIFAPGPSVKMNYSQGNGINTWIMNNSEGNGVALFDAVNSTYTSNSEITQNLHISTISVFPNPTSSFATIKICSDEPGTLSLFLKNSLGQRIAISTNIACHQGINTIDIDLTSCDAGCYVLLVTGLSHPIQCKIIKINSSM